MLQTDRDRLHADIKAMAEQFGTERTALLPLLKEIKKRYHQIDSYSMQVVADLLGIHPVEVHSVVSFYAFLGTKKEGEFVIRLCRTISCDMAGKTQLARQFENELGIPFGETTPDGKFSLEWANCLGQCEAGPAVLVNEHVYTHVTPEKVHEILSECRETFGLFAPERKEVHL